MAKQTKAKLDKKGLSGLGLEKLVDILLEEAAANKALKARLQTALAGETGPDEMARLIDKRLDAIDHEQAGLIALRGRRLRDEMRRQGVVEEIGGERNHEVAKENAARLENEACACGRGGFFPHFSRVPT